MSLACSIIVPTRNRPDALAGLLRRLECLDDDDLEVEIVIVSDGGDLDGALVRSRFPVRLIEQPHRGPAAARNRGAGVASGRILAFTDDDCRPSPDWLQAWAGAHRANPEALLGGTTVNGIPSNVWSTASEVIVGLARRFYNDRPGGPTFFPSNNLAVPAAEFTRLGGFDPRYRFASEDRDLCDRWRHAGLPLVEVAAARVAHRHELCFRSFSRQHLAYGRGAWRYHRARHERGSGKLVSDLRFQSRLPGLFWRGVPRGHRARLLWPLAIWQVANLIGFLTEAWQAGAWNGAPRLAGEYDLRGTSLPEAE